MTTQRQTQQRLEHAPELLDEPVHDRAELEQSLTQLAEVNRLLGGRRAVLRSLRPFVSSSRTTRILDIGTGSADIPVAIGQWAARRGCAVTVLATDAHAQMRELAGERVRDRRGLAVGAADARALPYARAAFDIVLLSLTLHHFERAEQVHVLSEAARVASRAVVVNELERCRANYYGARLLAATRWRNNRLTRHDGPLSVLRAFTLAELRLLACDAGLRVLTLERYFFHRIVLVAGTPG